MLPQVQGDRSCPGNSAKEASGGLQHLLGASPRAQSSESLDEEHRSEYPIFLSIQDLSRAGLTASITNSVRDFSILLYCLS